jgi:hypothetical protein
MILLLGVLVSPKKKVNCASQINLINYTLSNLKIGVIDGLSEISDGEIN